MNIRNESRDRPISVQDEMAALLPFYITGRLGLRDQMRVEQWVEDSPQGPKALENAYADQRSAIDANEAIASPSGTLGQLLKDIDAEPSQAWSNYVGGNMASWIMSWLNIIPSTFTWGALVALLAITTIQSTLLWRAAEKPVSEIASRENRPPIRLRKGQQGANIRFTPDTSMKEFSALLHMVGARIIDGPYESGLFHIVLYRDPALPSIKRRLQQLAERKDIVQIVVKVGKTIE